MNDYNIPTYTHLPPDNDDGDLPDGHTLVRAAAPLPKVRPWKKRLNLAVWAKVFWVTQRAYFFARWVNHYAGFKCWAFYTKPLPWFNYWRRASKRAPQDYDNFSGLLSETKTNSITNN